jgi:hypothetical protein
MNIVNINFDEVYRRHLCRHSEFGINVLHIGSVCGVYLSLLAIEFRCLQWLLPDASVWQLFSAMLISLLPWLGVVAINVPGSVLLTTGGIVVALCLPAAAQPLPAWCHLLLLPLWHQLQLISHRFYTVHRDMSEFAERYRKSWHLSLLLAVYELPILVQFFLRNLRGGLRQSHPG